MLEHSAALGRLFLHGRVLPGARYLVVVVLDGHLLRDRRIQRRGNKLLVGGTSRVKAPTAVGGRDANGGRGAVGNLLLRLRHNLVHLGRLAGVVAVGAARLGGPGHGVLVEADDHAREVVGAHAT